VIVSTTSVAVAAGGISPVSLKPTTRGMSIETGWPSIAASASMPPTPQPSTPRPLTIVVCASEPTQESGHARSTPYTTRLLVVRGRGVGRVDDAGASGDVLQVVEGGLAEAQVLVPLAVLLVLVLHVLLERGQAARHVDHDGVVDDHLGRGQRVDLLRITAEVV